jgi:hypothetical protein
VNVERSRRGDSNSAARAEHVPEDDVDRCLRIFASASEKQGLPKWTRSDVEPPGLLRLYHAMAEEHFILERGDRRVPVVM